MDQDHDMPGMGAMPPSSMHGMRRRMMMHMTFYWGKEGEILFDCWPGRSTGMYALALLFVFLLGFLVEWLSHCRLIKPGLNHVQAGLVQTTLYTLKIGIAYLVMLGVMSFNGGVFLAAVAGQGLGFLIFGSRIFNKRDAVKGSNSSYELLKKKREEHSVFSP
ncbi:Copper transporter 6 [Morella rubra]|uniref:Copper transport protein n=1 Tax=Morella rubra TaxID=262757 RepID=A0A6A1WKW3_9ROSI|nr:Copper transporter 6 [Morella rubra]